MRSETAALLIDCRNTLGETPLWCARSNTLYWIDVFKPGRVFFWQEKTGDVDFWHFEDLVTGLALYPAGDLLIALKSEIIRFDPRRESSSLIFSMAASRPTDRFNDCACDRLGRLWIGSMPNNIADDGSEQPILEANGGIFCLTADGNSRYFDEHFSCPNAICWSPDSTILYAADSMKGWIYCYRFDLTSGVISHRQEFCRLDGLGIPDGAAVDCEGHIWNARWGAGVVARINPAGQVDQVVRLPTTNPTACVFSGSDLRTLYVTTARCGLSGEQLTNERWAGGVFSVTVDVPGLAKPAFGESSAHVRQP